MKKFTYFLFLILLFVTGLLVAWYFQNLKNNSVSVKDFKTATTSLVPVEPLSTPEEKIAPVSKKYNPCHQTLYYSFGKLDSRHNISPEKLRKIMQDVETIWEKPTGLNLFEYKEGAPFKINFIFDQRQQQINLFGKLNNKLTILKESHDNISEEYKILSKKYNHSLKKYLKRKEKLQQGAEKYEKEVSFWNKNGNITEDKYTALEKEKTALLEQQKDLEARVIKLNKLVDKLNSLSGSDKNITQKYNSSVNTYKNKYGTSIKFNQGEFFGNGINIYEFKDVSDLTLALAHEFGHALGLKHVKNPTSIMYYLIGKQNLGHLHLTKEDLSAFNNLCQ